jgi:sugar/nucleoside kinase (ribokinase family)
VTAGADSDDPAPPDSDDTNDDSSPAVLAVGAAAIDEWYAVSNLPEPDGGAFATEVTSAFGGVGANVAVALDRLGRDAGLVSRVGDDE